MSTIKITDSKLNAFYNQNPNFDILQQDLNNEAALSQLNWENLDRSKIIDLLKKYQRLLRLNRDPEVAQQLLKPTLRSSTVTAENASASPPLASLDSAHAIAAIPETEFIQKYSTTVGSEAVARKIYQNATAVKAKTMLMWANVHNLVASPYFRGMQANNVSGDIARFFEGLPSYQDLFGSLDYCECEHCQSIFSPAAYFVDLMRIIDRYITQPNDKLKLEKRRLDLARIELTCENTNNLVPYLGIVNKVIALKVNDLDLNNKPAPTTPETEKTAIDDVYKSLATATYPFNIPFNLPLTQIRAYLAQLKTRLFDVYSAFSVTEKDLAREYLELSKEEYALITTATNDSKALGKSYGVDDLTQPEIDKLQNLDKKNDADKNYDNFLARTGLTLDELNQLLYQNLGQAEIEANLCHQFFINRGLDGNNYLNFSPDSNQVINLNLDTLDRINRFVRLAKKLNWSFIDLDWVLKSITQNDNPTIDDDSATIVKIAKIKKIAETYKVKLDVICSFWHDTKTIGLGDSGNSQALFDIVFNNPYVLDGKPPYHPAYQSANPLYTDTLLTWSLTDTATLINLQNASRIAAGLKISLDDLTALGKYFFDSNQTVNLDVQNLSVLYRHSQLATLLKLPVNQYLILLSLLKKLEANKLNTLTIDNFKTLTIDGVNYLFDVVVWLRNSLFNVYELDYALKGNESIYVDTKYKDENINPFLESLWTLIPNSGNQSEQEEKLQEQLATFFGSTKEIVKVLITLSGKLLTPSGLSNYVQAFLTKPQDTNNNPNLDYIKQLIKALSRGLFLNQKLQLTPTEIDSIDSYSASYGITDFNQATVDNIRDIYTFKQILRAFGDDNDAFVNYVKSVNENTSKSVQVQVQALIKVTAWDEQQINQIYPDPKPDANVNLVKLVVNLKEKFDLSQKLGVDISFLLRLCTLSGLQISEWPTYQDIANSVKTTVKAKYDDDDWAKVYSKMNRGIEEQKRDALMAIALWKLDFKTPRNLYEYLLIDGEMSGCSEISYIKEALNATQLYLQRCRLGLEPGATTNNIPPIWWEWMMNYRIWEANRKVFLYPENYLDPGLRSSKTTLFKNLESQLLQADITPASVEDAYRQYIEGFSELAKLKYVDAYSCKVNDSLRGEIDVLFLFARTQTEPYSYYYCTREEGVTWTEWQKIDITIGSAYITPVYAFSKLFIFWVELKEKTDSSLTSSKDIGTQSNKNKFYNATVKYSFYDLSKKWIQPQTLISDKIIYFASPDTPDPNQLASQLPFKDVFEMDELYWNKVYAVLISPKSYQKDNQIPANSEKISILYGPLLTTDSTNPPTIDNLEDVSSSDQKTFAQNLYNSAIILKSTIDTKQVAYLPLNKTLTLDTELQSSSLVQSNEFLILGKVVPEKTPPLLKPEIDSVHGQLFIVDSDSPLQSNYFGDITPVVSTARSASPLNDKSFVISDINEDLSKGIYAVLTTYNMIDPQTGHVSSIFNSSIPLSALFGTLVNDQQLKEVKRFLFQAMADPVLFGNISKQNAQSIVIKNQPNGFILNNGDEAFLLEPKLNPYPKITDFLAVEAPLISPSSFVTNTIDSKKSQDVYNVLITYKVVDPATGKVDLNVLPTLGIDNLKALTGNLLNDRQLRVVWNILFNYPIVQSSSLAATGISEKDSEEIFAILNTYQLIDDGGRVSIDLLLSLDISHLLSGPGLSLSPKQVGKVRNALFGAPALMYLNYATIPNNETISDIHDYTFKPIRITTSAIGNLSRKLFTTGIEGLLSLKSQQIPVQPQLPFDRLAPSDILITPPTAIDGTQVDFEGLYGNYFWEIFFHSPWLIAMQLASNQQFDKAQKWLQYIFNPTISEQFLQAESFSTNTQDIDVASSSKIYQDLKTTNVLADSSGLNNKPIIDENGRVSPNFNSQTDLSFLKTSQGASLNLNQTREVRNLLLNYQIATSKSYYWQFQPFRNQSLQSLKDMLSEKDGAGNENQALKYWNNHPFDPHAIAGLRIGAYEKAIVMQYIDSLLDWGDYMFAQDSWESITQATLLYVYAYDLLGPRPKSVGKCKSSAPATFENIREKYKSGHIPQFLIDLENLVPHTPASTAQVNLAKTGQPFNDLDVYFCVPENEQFISYWDRVEDRLFKIRHCMNIQGVERQLDLFQPPLDVMQLVRAAASGNNILNALTHGGQDIPHYRFQYMIDRAKNITSTVIQLGASLLSALEKKDAEQIGILRSTQEENILNLMLLLKKKQIEEASETLDSLNKTLDGAKNRSQHYQKLIDGGLSVHEQDSQNLMISALAFETAASIANFISSPVYSVPTIFGLADGGFAPGDIIRAIGEGTKGTAAVLNQGASLAAIMGDHDRRREEWEFQKLLADDDITQIEKQIAASQVRLDIANQELIVHQKSIEQAKEVETFLKSKFSNQDLYQWMADRIATVYFQSYQIALDMALVAQKAYQYELNSDDAFITMQYWDSLKKGLLAGEGLMFALTQLEKAYLDNSFRHLEIEKTISLLQLNPQAFLDLKATGQCTFSLDEILFDYDFPGHYCRKIKSVSLSIPAIVGPYQNIKATLSQTYNAVVYQADSAPKSVDFLLNGGTRPDSGLRENWRPNQQIAISRGVDDSGMFVLNFNDERYLPFEGTGAVSKWELKMPKETNRIDFEQLSDVIIDLKYTALYDGGLEKTVREKLASKPLTCRVYFNMKQAFSSAWNNFLTPQSQQQKQSLKFQVNSSIILPNCNTVKLRSVSVRLTALSSVNSSKLLSLTIGDGTANDIKLTNSIGSVSSLNLGKDQFTEKPWTIDVSLAEAGSLNLLSGGSLDPTKFQNLELILEYVVCVFGDAPCQ
ncbi:hypothetical protein B1L04_25960 [Microcystis aeruginosa KW]|uniref:Virulence plasmid A protein n=1 Tax=Microcystis aeruginosa KW TaxID=1960155 RepID=A0A1V4BPN4_MICAE|nr:neuraminidase-like domain-containing protein [Microcystis aeruginosa]OPF15853.1 hypothetical protein B1L04_25960 [Microcystis aeruginosa KW]